MLGALPVEVLFRVLACLSTRELAACVGLDRRWAARDGGAAGSDELWRLCCARRWVAKSPRFRLTEEREELLCGAHPDACWRQIYCLAEEEGRRELLTLDDLRGLEWAFNNVPESGGLGRASLQFVRFGDELHISRYPPLAYWLSDYGRTVHVAVGQDIPHHVSRLESWEWLITNQHVTFVSHFRGEIDYSGRGFADAPEALDGAQLHRNLRRSGHLQSWREELIREGYGEAEVNERMLTVRAVVAQEGLHGVVP